MGGVGTPRVTNSQIYLLLGEIKRTTESLDKAINGNGKPGLIADHESLKRCVEEHVSADATEKKAKESAEQKKQQTREKISGRTWAVILAFIGAFAAQTMILIFLFVRTGGIK